MPPDDAAPDRSVTAGVPPAAGPSAAAPATDHSPPPVPAAVAEPATADEGSVTDTPGETATIDELEAVLDGVDAALRRLDDGTYGKCRSCGDVVEDDRLSGDPVAELCEQCASAAA